MNTKKKKNPARESRLIALWQMLTIMWLIGLIVALVYLFDVSEAEKEAEERDAFLRYERQYREMFEDRNV